MNHHIFQVAGGISDSLTCLASSRALLLGQHLPSLTAELTKINGSAGKYFSTAVLTGSICHFFFY